MAMDTNKGDTMSKRIKFSKMSPISSYREDGSEMVATCNGERVASIEKVMHDVGTFLCPRYVAASYDVVLFGDNDGTADLSFAVRDGDWRGALKAAKDHVRIEVAK
jgi:hypothetical protein